MSSTFDIRTSRTAYVCDGICDIAILKWRQNDNTLDSEDNSESFLISIMNVSCAILCPLQVISRPFYSGLP